MMSGVTWRWWWGALLAALYLLLCVAMDGRGFRPVVVDSHSYMNCAEVLLRQGRFAQEMRPGLLDSEFARTPGYPFLLAGALWVDLKAWVAITAYGQRLLWAGFVIWFTGILCQNQPQYTGRRLTAIALLLFLPVCLVVTSSILSETVFTVLAMVGLVALARGLKRRHLGWTALAGLTLGAATLVRPVGLHLPLILTGAGWLRSGSGFQPLNQRQVASATQNRKSYLLLATFLLLAYLIPAGWMLRNWNEAGHFALSSLSGPGLALHRAGAIARLDVSSEAEFDESEHLFIREVRSTGDIFHAVAVVRREYGLNDFDAGEVAGRVAMAALRAEAVDYLLTVARNLVAIFSSPSDGLLLADLVARDANFKDSTLSGSLREGAWAATALHLLLRGLYLGATLLAPAWLLWRNRHLLRGDPLTVLALAAAAYMILLPAALTITYDRFLFPVLPVIGLIYCRAKHLQ